MLRYMYCSTSLVFGNVAATVGCWMLIAVSGHEISHQKVRCLAQPQQEHMLSNSLNTSKLC